jgi:membrane protease YdiL (CAAX protease family)
MTSFPPPSTAPAGWYPDPSGHGLCYFDGTGWTRLGAPPVAAPHPTLPLPAAVGALVVLAASLLISGLVGELVDGVDAPEWVFLALSATIGYGPSLGWFWYVRRQWADGQARHTGWQFHPIDLAWGPLTWLAAIVAQAAVAAIVLGFDIPLTSNVEDVAGGELTTTYVVGIVLTAVVAAPFVEELVFRGIILRGLVGRVGAIAAIVLQGFLFGIAHVDPVRGAGNIGLAMVLSAIGMVLGGTAFLTRRIGAGVVAHAILNGVVVTLTLTGVTDRLDNRFDDQLNDRAVVVAVAVAVMGQLPLEQLVVDETHVAEPGGHQHHSALARIID